MRDLEQNTLTGAEETKLQYDYIEKAKSYIKEKEERLGRKLTCCVKTFGCQMNARDSEKLVGILTDIGYVETEDEHADFVIYNTCTVRENANNTSWLFIQLQKEKSGDDDRTLWLYDAGAYRC